MPIQIFEIIFLRVLLDTALLMHKLKAKLLGTLDNVKFSDLWIDMNSSYIDSVIVPTYFIQYNLIKTCKNNVYIIKYRYFSL